jgi:hypothetical protein
MVDAEFVLGKHHSLLASRRHYREIREQALHL